jgi:hypothetical protein
VVSPAQQYPDLDRMTPSQLEEFLGGSDLLETQKDDIRQATEKVRTYGDAIFWHRLHAAKNAWAVADKEIAKEVADRKLMNDGWRRIKATVEPLYNEIESEIHKRLHSHGGK